MQAIKKSLLLIREDLAALFVTEPVTANSDKRADKLMECLARIQSVETNPENHSAQDSTARKLLHLLAVAMLLCGTGLFLLGNLTIQEALVGFCYLAGLFVT